MSSKLDSSAGHGAPPLWLVLTLATACGVTVANLYYAQPLLLPISQSFGLDLGAAGLIVTMLQIGYVIGLIFLAPLGDLVENKKLILITLAAIVVSLLICAAASHAGVFVAASLLIGITTVATQMILPLAAHLAPERRRGQIVGTVMSGLLFGILLARPLSTLVAGAVGWRGMYALSAAAICALLAILALVLPKRQPVHDLTYGKLIHSLWDLLRDNPVLQRRAAYQAALFGAFSLFWTAVPLLLQAPPFQLGHLALSAFLLSGVAGAFVAPLAGRMADHGHSRALTGGAMIAVALSFVLVWLGGSGSLVAMIAAGIVLDAGVQANMVTGQRAIYALPASIRSRLNALYLAIFFFGGAIGSALSGYAVNAGGAFAVAGIGLGFALLALALFATEFLPGKSRGGS